MYKIDSFLRDIEMHPDQTDIDRTADMLISEMNAGLSGKPSSLHMLPTYIRADGRAPENRPVIAIDAGGTNLRVGLVTFSGGRPVLTHYTKSPVPGSEGEISADEFFDALAEKILPLTKESTTIGFCFSYPAVITPDRDGKIIQLNKELRVTGAEGKMLGAELKKKLAAKGVSAPVSITILNDTAAGLMGGLATQDLTHCDGLAGLILGTGYNVCYVERAENIKKIAAPTDMIINTESGCCDKPFRGEADRLTDEQSVIPGDHLLEKMVSGAYMGHLASNAAVLAAERGLLSAAFKSFEPFSSMELDAFLRGENNRVSAMCAGGDRDVLTEIVDAAFERSARVVCANLLAVCLQTGGGRSAEHPFCVVAEGSTFYNSLLFREKLDKQLEDHVAAKHGRHIIYVKAEDATMTGTALSALLN